MIWAAAVVIVYLAGALADARAENRRLRGIMATARERLWVLETSLRLGVKP